MTMKSRAVWLLWLVAFWCAIWFVIAYATRNAFLGEF